VTATPDSQRIVVLIGSGFESSRNSAVAGEPSILEKLLDDSPDETELSVISFGLRSDVISGAQHVRLMRSDYGRLDRLFDRLGLFDLRGKLAEYSIGRLLNSISPTDQGRVFWRTVRRNAEALQLLTNSDIAIAADIHSTRTAWFAVKKKWVGRALYDHRATSLGSFTTNQTASPE